MLTAVKDVKKQHVTSQAGAGERRGKKDID